MINFPAWAVLFIMVNIMIQRKPTYDAYHLFRDDDIISELTELPEDHGENNQ